MRRQDTKDQACLDLDALGVKVWDICIFFDEKREHTADCWGIAYEDRKLIWIHPGLLGAELYRVVLHEIGHILGLEHTRTGIMAAKKKDPADYQIKPPTLKQRKAWAYEIASQVLEHRRKKFGKAAA